MTEHRLAGSRPEGAAGEEDAARRVRAMFGKVARRYDLLNHLLSMDVDRIWRARTRARLSAALSQPGVRVLDMCCGTADLLFLLEAQQPEAVITGCDFSRPMLALAQRKAAQCGSRAMLIEADALQLPVSDDSLDVVATAFGFRNLVNYESGLAEMVRVLRPGGTAAILEFTTPPAPLMAAVYNFYAARLLPAIGAAISDSGEAYKYLPQSVRRFPKAEELAGEMRRAGFSQVSYEYMTCGIVALHLATR
jgi:demethylmenaquinone methyltransferase/2-methoxy-6-polyprenyl-1,4-benzoquinol methylase